MKKLTDEEKKAHNQKIKHIRDRALRARARYCTGDITVKKLKAVEREVKQEEHDFIKESGVIMYFGNLFQVEA